MLVPVGSYEIPSISPARLESSDQRVLDLIGMGICVEMRSYKAMELVEPSDGKSQGGQGTLTGRLPGYNLWNFPSEHPA